MNIYTLGAYLHSTATLIKGVQDSSLSAGMQQIIMAASGAVSPSFAGVGRLQPQVSFTSTAIKTILAALDYDGAAMAADKMFLQQMLADGTRSGASLHICVTMANGLLIPVTLTAPSLPAPATISCLATPRSADGSASPIALSATTSLEALQDFDTECYVLGAVTLNGSELEGVDTWTLNFGVTPDIVWGSGHVYPTFTGVISITPSFTISTFDIAKFVAWTEIGTPQGDTDSTVELQDQAESGVRGSSPITFTIDAGMAHFNTVGAGQGNRAVGQVTITPIADGVANIIAITGIT